jgi:anti-sigma factor RsiW
MPCRKIGSKDEVRRGSPKEVHPNLGAYVLGGLESEEETEVQRHLAFCPMFLIRTLC